MDDRLDRLLDASAPSVASRSHDLRRDLDTMVAETEAMTSGRGGRRVHRLGIFGLAAAGVLGVGAAAGAAGLVPWFDQPSAVHGTQRTPAGEECQVTYTARPFEDPAHPVSSAARAAALAEAQDFLPEVDLAGIGAKAGSDALFRRLNVRLSQHLKAKGLSTYAVGVGVAEDCASSRSGR